VSPIDAATAAAVQALELERLGNPGRRLQIVEAENQTLKEQLAELRRDKGSTKEETHGKG
jgi:hypothetical protein